MILAPVHRVCLVQANVEVLKVKGLESKEYVAMFQTKKKELRSAIVNENSLTFILNTL